MDRHADERRPADDAPRPRGGEQEDPGVADEAFGDETAVLGVEGDPLWPSEPGVDAAGRPVGAELDDLVAGGEGGAGDEERAEGVERQVVRGDRGAQPREHAHLAVVAVHPVERAVAVPDDQVAHRREPDPGGAAEFPGQDMELVLVVHPIDAAVLAGRHIEGVVRPPGEAGRVHDPVAHRFRHPFVGQPVDRVVDLFAAPAADGGIQVALRVVHRIRDDVELLREEAADRHRIRLGLPVVQAHPDLVAGPVRDPHPEPGRRHPVHMRLLVAEKHPQALRVVHGESAARDVHPSSGDGVVRPDPLDRKTGPAHLPGAPNRRTGAGGHGSVRQVSSPMAAGTPLPTVAGAPARPAGAAGRS